MKKWFTNWISGLRKGTDVPYPENIPHFRNIGGKSLRLKPINKWPKNQSVFNCMSYFIFCPKHQKIAVCDNSDFNRQLAVYLPFLYLTPNIKHRLTEVEGLSLILSDGDSQLMTKYKEERPFDTNNSYVKRIDINQPNIVFTEFMCFTRLHCDNPVLQCCRKTSRILWMSAEDFQNNEFNGLWATILKTNELFAFLDDIRIESCIFEEEYLTWAQTYDFEDEPENRRQMILKELKITKKQIHIFFIDFIEHCFPLDVLTYVSFKDYLRKFYHFSVDDKYLRRLFNSCAHNSINLGSFLCFEGLLICLAYLDFECPSNEYRLQFVFGYYDFDRDGYLSEEELREMVRDIDTNQSQEEIERVVSDNMFMNESEKGMTNEEFYMRVHENWLVGTDKLCRFDYPILKIILSDLEIKEKSGFKKRLNQYFRRLLND